MNWLQTDNARRYAALKHLPLLVPPGGARQRGAGLRPHLGAAVTLGLLTGALSIGAPATACGISGIFNTRAAWRSRSRN